MPRLEIENMGANRKTKEQLVQEVEDLRLRIAELEKLDTERKQAEEALRSSEARYRTLFETSIDGINVVSSETTAIKYANPAMCRMLGYSAEEMITLSVADIHPKEVLPQVIAEFEAHASGKKMESHNLPCLRKDGTVFYADIRAGLTDIDGVKCNVGFFRDITERKRAEEALRESEARIRLALKHAPVSVAIMDREYRFLWAFNQRSMDPAVLIGHTPTELFPPETAAQMMALGRKVLETEEEINEQLWVESGGQRLFLNTYLEPIRDAAGQVVGIGIATINLTQSKLGEEALKESEEKYRSLFENANEAIFVAQDGKIVFVNPKTITMIGYSAEVLMSRPFIEFIYPDDQDMVIDRHVSRLKGEEITPIYSFRINHRDGNIRWVELNAVLINWKGKSATLNFLTDITERWQAEQEKRKLEEQLQRAEKMEALGTLAGGVAHDLNNVLGIIVGYSEMLLFDLEDSSPLRPGLVNIMGGGQRAAAIVQDLLTLARRGVSGRKALNLNKIIVDSQKSPEFENLASYHPSIKIKTDLEPDLLNISGSAVHLSKTLFNLISNASEAMLNGGILTIKTSNQYLDRAIEGYDEIREGDYVVLSVSDTGEGISADDLKRIFEPFYTKKVMGRSGTGLGLAVVWGTVKDHQGYINVQSEKGKGSIFTLYFPVTREEITAEEVTVSIAEYLGKGETVLIVDDIKGQRDLASTMLRKLNYNAISVFSGEESVIYLKEHTVDLLVLDMIMDPGMDGLDTYKKILEINPHQKAIIVSGFSETDRVKAAQKLGAGAYVKKPYVIEKLGLAVRKELDRVL